MKPSYAELEKRVAELERKVSEQETLTLDLRHWAQYSHRIVDKTRMRVADMARRGRAYSKAVRG